MNQPKKCLCCGQAFEPTCHISRQKYCSRECCVKYNNAKRYYSTPTDTCPECGGHIEQSGERGKYRRFCTDRCRVQYQAKKRRERNRNRERPAQVCPNCGIEFQPEWGHGNQRRFCSDACRITWWREYHKAHPKELPAERKCLCCGKPFNADHWHGGEYCSRECYLKAMSAAREQVPCGWCGEEFSALISTGRKYCCIECYTLARQSPQGPQKGSRRISYQDSEEWRGLIAQAANKAELRLHRGRRVWLVCGVTSMYTGLDGLLGIIRYRLNKNPFDGGLYVFCDTGNTMLKYLEWDGAGFSIGKRRAQSGSYPWPPSEAGEVIEITEKEFVFLKTKSIVPFGQKPKPKKRGRPKKDGRKKKKKSKWPEAW